MDSPEIAPLLADSPADSLDSIEGAAFSPSEQLLAGPIDGQPPEVSGAHSENVLTVIPWKTMRFSSQCDPIMNNSHLSILTMLFGILLLLL